MAAVTVDSAIHNVAGSMREIVAQIDIANSGDTWATGLRTIKMLTHEPDANMTSVAYSGGTITFTTGGAITNMQIKVTGY